MNQGKYIFAQIKDKNEFISDNARGICEVAGRKRSGAEFSDGHFAYPELCDVAPPAEGGRATSATRACPRALCKIASTER